MLNETANSPDTIPFAAENTLHRRKFPISCWRQFEILTRRNLLAMFRDFLTVQLRVICHILVGCLIGFVFWNIGNDAGKVYSNQSCIFFILMFIFFGNALPTVLSFPLEASVFLREHLNSWYSVSAYFFAKFFSDIPLQVLCPTLLVVAAYFETGQPNELGRFCMFWSICLLTTVLSQTLGLVAGAAFRMQIGVFLVPASCIPMLIFSGFFIRFSELAGCFHFLTKISYFRYSFEGSIQSLYGYGRETLNCSQPVCVFKYPEKILLSLDMSGDRYHYDVMALIIWIIFLQILLYICLIIKVKRSQ